MVLGKRKSPFIGVTESQETPILYSRYTDVSELLLEPVKRESDAVDAKQGAHAAEMPVENPKKKPKREKLKRAAQTEEAPPPTVKEGESRKKPKREKLKKAAQTEEAAPVVAIEEEHMGHAANGAAETGEGPTEQEGEQPESKAAKKKNKKARAKARAAAAASGPGNAAEAQQIRSIMGIAPAGEAQKQQPGTFTFGFAAGSAANGEAAAAPVIEHEAEDEPAAENVEGPKSRGNPEVDARLRRVLGQDAGHVPRRVFVGGMPFSYDEEEVREYWSYCGEIEDMDLMRFPDTNRFKGIAFITFADDAGYREALKCNGMTIDEVKIKVEPCMSDGPKGGRKARPVRSKDWSQHTSPAPKTPGYHVAYVGNVDFTANQDQLRGVFQGCEVTVVRLHTDKDTGKSKGYAHVHFADEDSLDRAVSFNGTKLLGRSIKVGYAQPKK